MSKQQILTSKRGRKPASRHISVLVPQDLKADLQRLAETECRTLSGQVVMILQRAVQEQHQEAQA